MSPRSHLSTFSVVLSLRRRLPVVLSRRRRTYKASSAARYVEKNSLPSPAVVLSRRRRDSAVVLSRRRRTYKPFATHRTVEADSQRSYPASPVISKSPPAAFVSVVYPQRRRRKLRSASPMFERRWRDKDSRVTPGPSWVRRLRAPPGLAVPVLKPKPGRLAVTPLLSTHIEAQHPGPEPKRGNR
jgi:hypothetical protein